MKLSLNYSLAEHENYLLKNEILQLRQELDNARSNASKHKHASNNAQQVIRNLKHKYEGVTTEIDKGLMTKDIIITEINSLLRGHSKYSEIIDKAIRLEPTHQFWKTTDSKPLEKLIIKLLEMK